MPATVGSADFLLAVDSRGFITGLVRAEQQARTSAGKIDAALSGATKNADKSAQGFAGTLSGIGKAAGGIAAVTAATAALSAGMERVAEQTQKAAQAQFQVNKLYGQGAETVNAFARAQADLTGRTVTDFQKASATAATLVKNYGFTQQQVETLIARSADLAAVSGKEIPDAAERVIAAMRGEAEAAEALGLTLNSDAVKAMAQMTDEQRRNFETLSQVEKAQIIYRELLRQTADVQGAAAERANEGVGAFDKLSAASDRLAAALGAGVAPGLGKIAAGLADATLRAAEFVEQMNRLQALGQSNSLSRLEAIMQALSGRPAALIQQIMQGQAAAEAAGAGGWQSSVPYGPTADDLRIADQVRENEQKRRAKERLDQARDDAERQADAAIKGIQKEIEAAERAHQQQRIAAEKARDAEIKAAEDKRDGAIRAIEQQAQATADSYERQIIAAEKARDAELRAAEQTRDEQLRALDEVQQAAKDANAAQIREQERQRDKAKEAAEARRDAAVDALDAEKRERDNARRLEDRARDDEVRDILRDLETTHTATMDGIAAEIKAVEKARDTRLRALDREADRARRASEKRIEGIEREIDAENERHRIAMQALEDEADARLEALDLQLKALDAQEKQADAAERLVKLQRRLADAQRDLTRAQGTGTPEQIAEARNELTRALRVGDELSIANARERLQKLAGQGAQAVQDANERLAEAQQAIQDETVDQTRQAERDKIEAAKDAIRDRLEAEKRAAEDENRQRERSLQAERDAAQKGLKARLDALDKRKHAALDTADREIDALKKRQSAEKDAYDDTVERVKDEAEAQKRAIEDARRFEDRALEDKKDAVRKAYEEEQRQIKATYDDEDTGTIPALRRAAEAAEREFGRKRQAVQDAYDEEQRRIRETYDDKENGIIAKLRQHAEEAARSYAAKKQAVNDAYQAEKDRIREVYDDPENGILAKLDQAKQRTIDTLKGQIEAWQTWKKDVTEEIKQALDKLEEFLKRVGEVGNITITQKPPDGEYPVPGGIGPPIPRGSGGDMAYGPVVRNASADSYWTSGGTHGGHPAADIFAPKGSPIYAPVGGTISGYTVSAGGNAATMIGDDGRAYYFAHGNVPFINGRVERGQQIGEVGQTGNAQGTAPHLHFAIARNASTFGELNGSGDIDGDSSYWGSGGTARSSGNDEEIEISLFGRTFRIRRGRANVPGDVGRWIAEGLRAAGAPADWLYDMAQIAAAETGRRNSDGSVEVGTGSPTATNNEGSGASGLLQMMPGTFAENMVPGLGDIFNPVHNAAAAANYIKRRYGSPRGTPYFRTGAFSTIDVEGYRNGTMIREPTLLAGLHSGRLGIAGETGQPERLLGVDDTRAYSGGGAVSTVNFHGVTYEEAERRQRSTQRRHALLYGIGRVG